VYYKEDKMKEDVQGGLHGKRGEFKNGCVICLFINLLAPEFSFKF
jgi:hypothetical protein